MKFLSSSLLVVLSLSSVVGSQAQAARKNDLSSEMESLVVSALNEAGEDSWKENDIETKFLSVQYLLTKKRALVDFNTRKLKSKGPWLRHSTCVIKPLDSASEILYQEEDNAWELGRKFRLAVEDCVFQK